MTIRRYITPIFALTLLPALSERILAQEIRPDFSVGTPHYFLSDHLGSVRAIVDGNGDVEASYDYLPYGTLWSTSDSDYGNDYLFGGKEKQTILEANLYDSNARFLSTDGIFTSIDPQASRYPHINPYGYCASDPIKFIDPDGRDVKPAGTAELVMMQNTLPKDARNYVRLDKNGLIDRKLLNSYDGKSLYFNNLKTMVNSDMMVEVVLDDKFTFMGKDGKLGIATMSYCSFDPKYDSESDKDLTGGTMNGLSTGESGFMGK